ncbi:SH3-like domain-containing protein [Nitrosomonas eutropha]|uniref:SH3-like domain-containing protein n=1 Tax=Nitrosomonas eutropha TaxID=916 RepID=A0A1I7J533_9PROT|nr:SH3 domain-containing protein [Nitrosomonas eutropha]SFU80296.1 SH3-like domain-containing protein [Nitrosomonas eutropha]
MIFQLSRAGFVTTSLLFPLLILLFFSCKAVAQERSKNEFLSIATSAVTLYDAPSLNAGKLYVAGVNLPLEVVVKVVGWVKIRDYHGYLAWVEDKNLSPKRFVIVNASIGSVYQSPDQTSSLVFQARQDVVLEWLGAAANGWVKVRHQDGQIGYIRTDQVWGV